MITRLSLPSSPSLPEPKRCPHFGPVYFFPLAPFILASSVQKQPGCLARDITEGQKLCDVQELFSWALDEGLVLWLGALVDANMYHQTLELHTFSVARCLRCERHRWSQMVWGNGSQSVALHQQHQHPLGSLLEMWFGGMCPRPPEWGTLEVRTSSLRWSSTTTLLGVRSVIRTPGETAPSLLIVIFQSLSLLSA